MRRRIGTPAPIRSRSLVGAAALLAATVSCSSGSDEPSATSAAPTTAPPTAAPPTTTVAPTTTVPAGPPLSARLSLVEVSLRLVGPASEQVVSISTDAEALADIEDLGADDSPAWCTGADDPGAESFVVRVGPPAVAVATGGIEQFELEFDAAIDSATDDAIDSATDVTTDPAGDSGPAAATITVVVDGSGLVATGVVETVGDDARTGTFSASAPDGTTLEGAFRCE